jgi:hypothetical protein
MRIATFLRSGSRRLVRALALMAVAFGTSSADGVTYYACLTKVGGLLYFVTAGSAPTCRHGDSVIVLNQGGGGNITAVNAGPGLS